MKHLIYITLLVITISSNAQNPRRDRIKTLKVAFISEKLALTPDQAEKFWPVYNAFDEKTFLIRSKEMRSYHQEIKQNLNSITEDRAKTLLQNISSAEDRIHQLHQNLVKDLLKIIPPKKIILLNAAEKDFKRRMLEEFKKPRKFNR